MRHLDQAFKWTTKSRSRNRLTNIYEPLQPYIITEFAKTIAPDVFLDVGANIGYYSVILNATPEVHAFEPVALCYEELLENTRPFPIHCHKVAVSNAIGEVDMAIVSDLSGANSVADTTIHADKNFSRTERVETNTLDKMFGFRGAKILIKMDIEGHELAAIEGAERLLMENQCLLQIEVYKPEVAEMIESLGFRKLFKCGPDAYFANFKLDQTEVIEDALAEYLEDSKKPPLNRKKIKLFRGISLELSERWVRLLKKVWLNRRV
ncbi:FkbM family methyltransferase [Boseongicola aestuarii]|uniref:Methyltransferase FkbM domain-containing protein n=1 Tax=Boseongicola aestuarii TaxID=1470561 RepID=A0A238J2Z1_9RHOB|nr:FkbM family methyltransferase [Boseongicola aestuarii]SMX24264.1 hypothetical protein BOA8489_02387 [Boseongicola aestuarii]